MKVNSILLTALELDPQHQMVFCVILRQNLFKSAYPSAEIELSVFQGLSTEAKLGLVKNWSAVHTETMQIIMQYQIEQQNALFSKLWPLKRTIILAIMYCFWRCPWCNGYRRRIWTRRHEFKSWTWLIAFHIALILLGKVWIQLFSLQLWVNSRADQVLQSLWGN